MQGKLTKQTPWASSNLAGARIVAIISVVVILLSIVIFCLETLPEFKHYTIYNMTSNITRIVEDQVPTLSDSFFLIETTCIVSGARLNWPPAGYAHTLLKRLTRAHSTPTPHLNNRFGFPSSLLLDSALVQAK